MRIYKAEIPILKILEAATYLAGVGTLFLLLFQLREDARNRRAERALSFVTQFTSEPLSSHRLNLIKPWVDYRDQLAMANQGGGLTRAEIDELAIVAFDKFDAANPQNRASLSLYEMASFYDSVHTCVEEQLCDPQIIDANLREFAADLYCTDRAVIERMRTTLFSAAFAKGLESFGKGKC